MPIRINFLAEEQAVEQLRRQDPVKRSLVGAGALVGLVVIWMAVLVVLGFKDKSNLKDKDAEWEGMKKDVEAVEADDKKTRLVESKLTALTQLATNRFQWGPVLNAMQQTMPENVAVLRFLGEQSYSVFIPPPPSRENRDQKPKPPSSTERISLKIRAKDSGERSKSGYAVFMNNITTNDYFKQRLQPGAVRIIQPPTTMMGESDSSKPAVTFEVEVVYPEVVR